jgi:hypothetical protein
MKKTLLVCSDIHGTYNVLSTVKQMEIFKNIEEIKNILNLDQVVFSFVSTLGCSEIEEVVNNSVLPILEETKNYIIVGPHFGSDGFTYNGSSPKLFSKGNIKGVKIANYIKLFSMIFPDAVVSNLIYIDDSPNINPLYFLSHIKNGDNELKEVTFIVKEDGFSSSINSNDYKFNISTMKKRINDFMAVGLNEVIEKETLKKGNLGSKNI